MPAVDACAKEYVSNPVIFADLFNYYIFSGKPVLKAAELVPIDSTLTLSLSSQRLVKDTEKRNTREAIRARGRRRSKRSKGTSYTYPSFIRVRDLAKHATIMRDGTCLYAILGVENQSFVDHLMPLRNMLYDAMTYQMRAQQIWTEHENGVRPKLKGDERLSRFAKDDKLKPVITLILNLTGHEWDGALSLHDLLEETSPEILAHIPDYPLNIIDPHTIPDQNFSLFKSDLGTLLYMFKYSNDDEKMSRILDDGPNKHLLGREAVRLFNAATGSDIPEAEGEEETDVCFAIEEIKRKAAEQAAGEARKQAKQEVKEARQQAKEARQQAKEARQHAKEARQHAKEARQHAKQEVKEARQQAEEDQARIVAAAMGAFGVDLDGAMKALGIDERRYPRVRELVAGAA